MADYIFSVSDGSQHKFSNFSAGSVFTFNPVSVGPTFDPDSISGLVQWYDASNSESLTVDMSDKVSAWADLSTVGNDVSQGIADNQPTLAAGAVNGLDALAFDDSADSGAGQFFEGSFVYDVPLSIFIACQTDDEAANKHIVHYGNTTNNALSVSSTDSIGCTAIPYDGGVVEGAAATVDLTNNQTHILTALFNADNDRIARIDGGNEGTNTSNEPVTPANLFTIARYGAGIVDRPWSGYICEMVIYNAILTTDEQQMVEEYLADKWGVTLV